MRRKPRRLLLHRPAPVGEMIGAARHARGFRRGPILGEFLVDPVAALGRLDPGGAKAGGAHSSPSVIAVIVGDGIAASFEVRGARDEIFSGDTPRGAAGERLEAEPKNRAE